MKPLIDGQPASDESWRELAEHSLTHDDLPDRGNDDLQTMQAEAT